MHRTTIPLEGIIEKKLRLLAAKEKKSFKELINELLKKGLEFYGASQNQKTFHWNTGTAQPEAHFDPSNRATYLDAISKQIP